MRNCTDASAIGTTISRRTESIIRKESVNITSNPRGQKGHSTLKIITTCVVAMASIIMPSCSHGSTIHWLDYETLYYVVHFDYMIRLLIVDCWLLIVDCWLLISYYYCLLLPIFSVLCVPLFLSRFGFVHFLCVFCFVACSLVASEEWGWKRKIWESFHPSLVYLELGTTT